jgi:hypothetical protein
VPSTIYLPVATGESRSLAATWNSGRQKKNKPVCTVIECPDQRMRKMLRRLTNRLLSGVGANDKLYILAHGLSASGGLNQPAVQIGMDRGSEKKSLWPEIWAGGVWKGYTPKALAAHLEAEGLTKQIVDVRVFACGTGVAQLAALPSFAQQLKNELVQRGYLQVLVTGYLGETTINYNNRKYVQGTGPAQHANPHMAEYTATAHKGTKDGSGDWVPASTRKVTF